MLNLLDLIIIVVFWFWIFWFDGINMFCYIKILNNMGFNKNYNNIGFKKNLILGFSYRNVLKK